MRYAAHYYAKALVQALDVPGAKQDAIAKNFLELVRRNGDETRLKKILEEASRLSRGRGGAREVMIESARPLTKTQEKSLEPLMKSGDVIQRKVNPDLVAGVKLTVNDEMQFDGSMKAKLDKLFGPQL
jgi:F0F1-type ATP synthase delta subunit